MGKKELELISASAGSGKTYTLTDRLAEAIENDGVRPEAVLATTFTNKAAAELTERVRLKLLNQGLSNDAQRILDGYIGTVNSVCGSILRDFAFEAGLPPVQTVMPDGEDQAIYNRALADVIERYAPDIEPAAQRLTVPEWQSIVKKISDSARTNNIAPAQLSGFAIRSWRDYQKLLPGPARSEKVLNERLTDSIKKAIKTIDLISDTTKRTAEAFSTIKQLMQIKKSANDFTWLDWARLSKLAPGKNSQAHFEPVVKAAAAVLEHPGLHRDIESFIKGIFVCAADGMQAFADFKARYGLIDFVDQERLCLDVLSRKDVQENLRARLDLVLVDEFQDTSPLQLALFLELMALAGRSIWVGDQKQAIYGFRGTDPSLMDAVVEGLVREPAVLKDSYRSRPELVAFTNAVFSKAFEPVGISPKCVVLNAKRPDKKIFNAALHAWRLVGKNHDLRAQALARGIAELLADGAAFQVEDPETKTIRNIRAGDIAILCRVNDRCAMVADKLEESGVRAAIPRSGLLATPEGIYGLACLSYLVDPSNTIAVAEIIHLTRDASDPLGWFEYFQNKSIDSKPWQGHPAIDALDEARQKLFSLTPIEAIELALHVGKAHEQALGWGDCATRLANLEALRGLAATYEGHCLVQQNAATPSGLVLFLNGLKNGDDAQAIGRDKNAVQVLTYHRAKGLEWPLVILYDLDAGERANPFDVYVIPSDKEFDVNSPLAGRWIRYWPWPFDKQKKDVGLDERTDNSSEKKQLKQRERNESVRLLYVGMTRARDYLIFATNEKGDAGWLDSLIDNTGQTVISRGQKLSSEDNKGKKEDVNLRDGIETVQVGTDKFKFKMHFARPTEITAKKTKATVFLPDSKDGKKQHLPARIIPSSQDAFSKTSFSIVETIKVSEHMIFSGNVDWQILGNAFHSFFAADSSDMPQDKRFAIAVRLLADWKVKLLKPQDFLSASDRLQVFIKDRYGEKIKMYHEWPVNIRIDNQKASGWIDLLLDTPKGYVIFDHKIFHESMEQVKDKVQNFASQLNLYRRAVHEATNRDVFEIVLNLPVHGVFLVIQ
jgi:ATP-dependent exoDNAse (exonuclease V) beta subunit